MQSPDSYLQQWSIQYLAAKLKTNKELKCDELWKGQVEDMKQTISVIQFYLQIPQARYVSTDAEKKRMHIG